MIISGSEIIVHLLIILITVQTAFNYSNHSSDGIF
jgi:hypothetical protein